MPLAPALAPLASLPQFVVCSIEPKAEAGKTDKIPQSLRFGYPVPGNAQDAQNWLTADAAFAWVESHTTHPKPGSRYGVGFVLTAADPVWCLDIDNCRTATGWAQHALDLLARFPNAAVEISGSGNGLHVWGLGRAPAHSSRNAALHAEFYTEQRFIALGDQSTAIGNVNLDWSAHLPALVEQFFPASTLSADPAAPADDWTDHPVPEWQGPADDETLLREASDLNNHGAKAKFGGAIRFDALYRGEGLEHFFPGSDGKAHDGSKADMALAKELAYWTGKDCDRMERLMRASGLARAKWDERGKYLRETILKACDFQPRVRGDTATRPARESDDPKVPKPKTGLQEMRPVDGARVLTPSQIGDFFGGYVYIGDEKRILGPDGNKYDAEGFRNWIGGWTFPIDNTKTTKDAFEAFMKSQLYHAPRAYSTCFEPQNEFQAMIPNAQGIERVNTYRRPNVPRKTGESAAPFLEHLKKLFPDEYDRHTVLYYMAAVVQHQGTKFGWAPVIQGVQGNGKSTLSSCVAEAVGEQYVHPPRATQLGSKFNAWMEDKVFFPVEDIYVADGRDDVINDLKPMITEKKLTIEGKGRDAVQRAVCGNFIFNTNHKSGLRQTSDERRFAVFYTPQQHAEDLVRDGMTKDYFHRLYKWLKEEDGFAIVTDLLYTLPIPDDRNPAKGSQRAPMTSTTLEAIEHGKGSVEQEILDAIEANSVGFRGGWISGHWLDELLERIGKNKAIPLNKRKELLEAMGYRWHPGVKNGRAVSDVMPDGSRPKLFVKLGHPEWELTGVAVGKAYSAAQAVRGTGIAATVGFGGTR